jgi:hypothetical protein
MVGSSANIQVLFPSTYRIEFSRLRQQLEEAHFSWVTEWKRQQAEFEIENIRFIHDPYWNKRLFSLQAAREGGHWFWRVTHTLAVCEGMSI